MTCEEIARREEWNRLMAWLGDIVDFSCRELQKGAL